MSHLARRSAVEPGDGAQSRGWAADSLAILVADLEARLAAIGQLFDVEAIAAEGADTRAVMAHYTDSDLGYRCLHSRAGCVHMALNPDGRFDPAGYEAQARMVGRYMAPGAPGLVLELGSGRGYNLHLLARRFPGWRFAGVDITPMHLRQARRRHLANVAWLRADFHDLCLADATVDLAYAVESLCHATDMGQALAQVHRVLRPGGLFVCVDGFEAAPGRQAAQAAIRRACRLAEKALAVDQAWGVDPWLDLAAASGLRLRRHEDLSHAILPNLERFERLASHYFRHDRVARLLQRATPQSMNRIAIAGLLIRPLVAAGIYTYRLVVLERPP